MTRTLTALVLAAILAAPVLAGPIQADSVAADAKWIVHFDMENFSASTVGASVIERARAGDGAEKLDWVVQNLGFDLTKDIAGVTLYGTSYEREKGVAIIRGALNEQTLVGLVEANASHQQVVHGDRIIHTWTDEKRGKPASGCFHSAGVLLMASSVEEIKQAIDVLEGSAPATADLPASPAGTFLSVSAKEHNGSIGHHAKAAIMQNTSSLAMAASESGGNIQLNVTLGANTEADATQIEQVLNGMRSFMVLSGENNPAAAELAQGVTIARNGAEVALSATIAADKVTQMMESCGQYKHGRHGAATE